MLTRSENCTNQIAEVQVICRNVNSSCATFAVFCVFFLDWIEKRNGHGRGLEHLEFSGSKIMVRGQRTYCMPESGKKQTNS